MGCVLRCVCLCVCVLGKTEQLLFMYSCSATEAYIATHNDEVFIHKFLVPYYRCHATEFE